MVSSTIDVKRIAIFIALAFGIAWMGGLVIYLTGGLVNSPIISGRINLALVILTVVYMGAPAIAHLLTRLISREGWRDLYLRPKFRQGWPYWIICWIAPAVFIFLGAAVFFVIFPQNFDPSLRLVRSMMESASGGQSLPQIDPWMVLVTQSLFAIVIAPILNAIPILGEEFGWRAYLLPKLMPLGGRKAVLLTGVIWGVWHWPVIAMGYNYGFSYPGSPWLGPIAMVWFTVVFGTLIGWASLRAGSVWPAVIGHGALNGMAGIVAVFVQGHPNTLLGPSVVGVIGSIGFTVVALILFLAPRGLETSSSPRPIAQILQPAASSTNP
jgi:membrane protease YdiL (CAAX protease family)